MKKLTAALFTVWLILLLPWLFLAPVSLMAFDAGETPKVYVFVLSIWTYPVAIGIAAIVRKWEPAIVLLPGVNVALCVVAGL